MVDLSRGVDLSGQELQECGECGEKFTASQPMLFCPPCHITSEILLVHGMRQYQRWGVLRY